ncbi:ATP-binding cassette domain-containing protein [Streptomyces sp. 1222.5]|uniref:ATP-binding cassette domain-containing protein n=1 Tax=Streptomyces sp. 1222.5 TaxID=1881026 RepID=UPI003EBE1790
MELLVEARQLCATGYGAMLFTSVNAVVHKGDVAVISGPPGTGRTALLLALSGRFPTVGGVLLTADGVPAVRSALRRRIAVAQALPVIRPEPTLRVSEAIAERRITAGRKNVTAQAVHETLAAMGLEPPPPHAVIQDMGTVEQTLFALALARTPGTEGICYDDVEAGLPASDRTFLREAVKSLAALGPALLVTSCDPAWGTVDITLQPAENNPPVKAAPETTGTSGEEV